MDQDATPTMSARTRRPEGLSTRRLLVEISERASRLVRKEVELARSEIKADLKAELAVVKGFAVTLVAGLAAVNMLLLAVVFALARVIPDWLAALVVAGGLLIIAALVAYISWRRRVTSPLALTRKSLKEDMQWAKERLA
jgi:cytochrome c biogenesis protein CcdA